MNLFNNIFKFIDNTKIKTHLMPILFVSDIPTTYLNIIDYNIFCIRLFIHSYNDTLLLIMKMYNLSKIVAMSFLIKYTDLINLYILDKNILFDILKRNLEIINLIHNNTLCRYNICSIDLDILNYCIQKEKIFFLNFLKIKEKNKLLSSIAHENNSNRIDILYSFLFKNINIQSINNSDINYDDRSELFRLIKHLKFKCGINEIPHFTVNNTKIIDTDTSELLIYLLINIHIDIYRSKSQMVICSKSIKNLIIDTFKNSDFNNCIKRTCFIDPNNYINIYNILEFICHSHSKFIHIIIDEDIYSEFIEKVIDILKSIKKEYILYNLIKFNFNY